MRIIENRADIKEGLDFLVRRDRRLRNVLCVAGDVPLRRRPAGFQGLARIVVGQQVSVASAEAIWGRLTAAFPGCPVDALYEASDNALRAPGLSGAKIKTLRALASACRDGLNLGALTHVSADEAHQRLTAVKGIGPWSADIYLLFCLGHADIFPVGDLALRKAVAEAFGLNPIPSMQETGEITAIWSPWRGVAAGLFWAYYRARRGMAVLPV